MSHEHNRDKILAAASELFLEGGLAALSVRAISKRAGLSTIGIYSHFDGKQGILDALYIEGFEMVAAAMETPNLSLDANARVLEACNAYLDVAENNYAHYRLIFGAADDTYTPSQEAQATAAKAFKGLLKLAAQYLPADASPKRVQQQAIATWAIVHGYVGLKNHSVADQIDMGNWRRLAMQTVASTLTEQQE